MFADMEKLGCVWFLTLALLAALPEAQTEDIPVDFAIGKSLVLNPPKPVEGNIVWKHGDNLVVDLETGGPEYYGSFKGRSTLDNKTGRLEISKMTKDDEGVYTVEINHKVLDVNYVAKIPNEVPKPEVEVKPLSCSPEAESCTFSCEGDTTGAGQVTYSWDMGDGVWVKREKDTSFKKTEVKHIKTITCQMKNVVGEKKSKPKDNPFIPKEKDDKVPVVGVVLGVLGIVLVGVIVGVVWWKRNEIMKILCPNGGPNAPTDENEGKPAELSYKTVSQNSSN